ncbi:hypothetical protein [Phytoactinopolyspora limicola]|uniref:hypothetical protein n=1 Tax=Phytoactinopolyspora limicola TaxID=2715536 RepID=UPI00140BFB48|nr:hypothetical protein [Phytoactinopolyspora limicola]
MTVLTVELDEAVVNWLRRRAEREGVEPAVSAARLLEEASAEPDPLEFVASFDSDEVVARDADAFLAEHGFGQS